MKTIIAVYVDDLRIASTSESEMSSLKKLLGARFKMKDLGSLQYILGINVQQETDSVCLNQAAYIEPILNRFGMDQCKPVSTPAAVDVKLVKDDGSKSVNQTLYQSMIGSLLYLAVATRPDIYHMQWEHYQNSKAALLKPISQLPNGCSVS